MPRHSCFRLGKIYIHLYWFKSNIKFPCLSPYVVKGLLMFGKKLMNAPTRLNRKEYKWSDFSTVEKPKADKDVIPFSGISLPPSHHWSFRRRKQGAFHWKGRTFFPLSTFSLCLFAPSNAIFFSSLEYALRQYLVWSDLKRTKSNLPSSRIYQGTSTFIVSSFFFLSLPHMYVWLCKSTKLTYKRDREKSFLSR